ncbi:MAG TPA: DUF1206 domain-containing protein [Intrasporangium sp.]|nr:DUF1206 domain-containing protein [Intrasporangium sp.]
MGLGVGDVSDAADEAGRRADNSSWIDGAVRFGLVVYGVVYLLVAWLCGQLALGDYSGSVSKGAFQELAEQPFGTGLLVVVATGMALLVLWRLLEAVVGHREEDGGKRWRLRAMDLFKAAVYGALGYKAVMVAVGDGGGGGSASTTTKVMELPAGQLIVGAVGVGIAVYGGRQIWRGLSEDHADHLAAEGRSGTAGSAYLLLGKIGYCAKGISFLIIGALFVYAAVQHDPEESGGLDRALREILEQPFGSWLLLAMAVGIGCYGLFQLARARHLSR